MRWLAGALVASALTVSAGWARGEPATASLDWQRAPEADGCIDRDGVANVVEQRLGRRVFVARGADLEVRGEMRPVVGRTGWVVHVELFDQRGESLGKRDLSTQAAECSALDESVALVVALMVDVPKERVAVQPEPEHVLPPGSHDTTPLRIPPGAAQRWTLEAHVGLVAGVGRLPGLGLGARLGIDVDPPGFWLTSVEGSYWLASQRREGDHGVEVGAQTLGVFVCPLALGSQLTLHGCLGQHVGRVEAQGFGFVEDSQQQRLYFGLAARAQARLRLSEPLFVRAGVELEAPLTRDRFVYTARDGSRPELFRSAPVTAAAGLGIGLHFH